MAKTGTILIIGQSWPEPTTTAAGCRILQLVTCLSEAGFEIRYASAAARTPKSKDLSEYGISEIPILLNDSSFDSTLKRLSPNLVIFDRFMTEEQFGWRVAAACPKAARILDTEDLHSLRASREHAFRQGKGFTPKRWKQHPATLRELASIFRCDLSLIISSYEMELLSDIPGLNRNLLYHLPFFFDPPDPLRLASFDQRADFVFVGNGRHQPNIDAIQFLRNDIWTGIRQELPEACLYIYGAYLPAAIKRMDDPQSGFRIKGWAEDLPEVLGKARLLLAPLRFGAGIKGKLVEAMRTGTPSITTPIGAEGMHAGMPWGGVIAPGTQSFVEAAVRLYSKRDEWESAHEKSLAILRNLYSREQHEEVFLFRIKGLLQDLEQFREQNLIGAMMLHHRMGNTRYLSKWIEAKNKLFSSRGSEV